MTSTTNGLLPGFVKRDSSTFHVIFAVGFSIFLVIALVAQTLGWQWRSWLPGAESATSVIGGVKAAVYTFMSYLN